MADKSVTYNGSYIIQNGMPFTGYVCGDQDNVVFQPILDTSNDETINTGTFTNTHQPLESNNVEWKKVEVNWTRSTTDNYNMLEQNQANCCEDGTTTGFGQNGSGIVTFSPDTTTHDTGNSSIKVITDGTYGGQGIGTNTLMDIVPGNTYSVKARVKGSGTVKITLCERDDTGQFIGNGDVSSSSITLTSSWQDISLTNAIPVGTKLRIKVQTSSAQAVTFWVDSIIVNCGNVASWVEDKTSFNANISLYGIMHDGEPELIGEYNDSEISPTNITESVIFDLAGGAGEPPLIKTLELMSQGKIRLELPMSLENYETNGIVLKHTDCNNYYDGWTTYKILQLTGTTDSYAYSDYVVGPLTITYDSDMKTNFSDLRFVLWNGSGFTNLSYFIFSQTNGSSATVFVKIPSLPLNPATVNVYMLYGNPTAATTSDPTVIQSFDNFEDGKYTGRSGNYDNYTIQRGTASIISSGQISGTYSLKHTGGNYDSYQAPIYYSDTNTGHIIDLDFKLITQGTGTSDPYVVLYYLQYTDKDNHLRVDTYWNGSNQIIRLLKVVSGTTTSVATYNWSSSKLTTGTTHHFKIISYIPTDTTKQHVTVIVDSTVAIPSTNPTFSVTNTPYKGFGCLQLASCAYDNILIRPYITYFGSSTGSEATVSSLTPEIKGNGTTLIPDNLDDDSQIVEFTLPSDYAYGCPVCFDITESNGSVYETPDLIMSPTDVFKLGFDHTAKYHALRVVIDTIADSTDSITWNYIKYDYLV